MKFKMDKCEVIGVTNKRKIISGEYNIHGQTLKITDKAKCLGVAIDSRVPWNAHVEAVTKKANNTLSFLRSVQATCYKSLVRPQREYASTVWNLNKNKINKMESVQPDYVTATTDTRAVYQPWSKSWVGNFYIQPRWQQVKAVKLYRIVHQLVDITAATILIPTGTYTRGHVNRFLAFSTGNRQCRLTRDAFKHSQCHLTLAGTWFEWYRIWINSK